MASSTGSAEHGGRLNFTPPPFITSFTDLLSGAGDFLAGEDRSPRGMFPRAGGVPKFKSAQPPSLPISPSSYFAIPAGLSPAELLDSPVLLTSASNILASPTTGAMPVQRFHWKQAADMIAASQSQQDSQADAGFSYFSFPSFNKDQQAEAKSVVAVASSDKSGGENNGAKNKLEDGYNWRKYGQKQVKGSEHPRSYYKCTHHSCSMKKKVERSLTDGRVTQIVYKGTHNHPKPLSTRRNSSSGGVAAEGHHQTVSATGCGPEHSAGATPGNSSVTFGDDDSGSQRSDGDEPDAKRWKEDADNEGSSAGAGGKPVREPRLVVQTLSDIDILDDGFRWRKYGQKVVKGNPNPRSYYKCTTVGCPVRKHVERASNDPRAVITTYEGKHNHDVPVGRGAASRAPATSNVVGATTGGHNHPYTLKMLSSSNAGDGTGHDSYSLFQQRVFTKDEPRDDLFVESLLC